MSSGLTVEGTTIRTVLSAGLAARLFNDWDEALAFGRALATMIDLPVVDRHSEEPASDE